MKNKSWLMEVDLVSIMFYVLYFVLLFLGTDQLRQRLADLGHEKEKLVDEVDHVSNMNKNLVGQIETKISGLENQTKDIKAQYIYLDSKLFVVYRTRSIITRSRFEMALDYKPQILCPTFLFYVLN